MKWTEMSEQERVQPIVQQVMGCFILDATAKGYETPDFPRGVGALPDFHWPIAYWNTDGECWMIKDIATDPKVFDPLHDMNDAWQVLQAMSTRYNAQAEFVDEPFAQFVDELLPNSGGEIWTTWKCMATEVAKWTPESICIAALKACGQGIED